MSFMDDYRAALKKVKQKEKETDEKTTTRTTRSSSSSFLKDYESELSRLAAEEEKSSVSERVAARTYQKDEEEEKRTWFDKGAFDDGYQFGDISKVILGTLTDVGENLGSRILGIGENIVDTAAYLAPYATQGLMQSQGATVLSYEQQKLQNQMMADAKDELGEFIKKDLYDEEKIAKAIISNPTKKILGVDAETDSILGEKSDSLVQSAGQLLGTMGLQAVGVPWWLTTGATTFGSEAENALDQDATYEEAGLSAAVSAGAEILSEKLSGGIKFGGKALDDALTKEIARNISNKTVRTLSKIGLDMVGEGAEEILSGVMSAVGQKITYAEDKELNELFSKEDAWESFIGGAALGGVFGGANAVKHNTKGVDYASGLTENEQKVVDKVYKDLLTEDMTSQEKKKAYDDVLRAMDRGTIDTDTIEEILDSDSHKAYNSLMEESEEFKTLYDTPFEKLSAKQNARLKELQAKHEAKKYEDALTEARSKRFNDTWAMVKGTRLEESYREKLRYGEDFKADFDRFKGSKHEEAARKTLQSAIDAGANNTNAVHDVIDLAAQISADTGKVFTVKSGEQIKNDFIARQKGEIAKLEAMERTAEQDELLAEMKSTLEGVESGKITVNGDITSDGITLNLDSANPLNRTVGHEITHSLEQAKVYDNLKAALYNYAKAKNVDIDKEITSRKAKYAGVKNADPEKELIADLVGDYVFTDYDFIHNLSTEHRNVFQKIYDEIKYLCKIATAGSKAARDLERVKRQFEKAYREAGESKGTQYSLSDSNGKKLSQKQVEYFKDSKVRDENGSLKVMYHGTPNGNFTVFKDGTYFTDSKEYADIYQNPGASSIRSGKVASDPKTFEVYLDIKKPFDINDAEAREIYINDYIKGGNATGINPYLSDAEYAKITTIDWTEGEDLRDFLVENEYDYDGLVLDEGATGGYGDEVKSRGKSYVVFSPEQVKNVDNKAPTSDPDIRYSLTEYTPEEKKAHNKAVLDYFGRTYKWAETGYVLLDGSKLDLSGKHEGAPGGYRTVDHRDIVDALGSDYGDDTYSGSLVQFMSEGNIRITPECNGINLSVKPTKAQEMALSDFISRARGEVLLDIDDFNGYTVASVEYPRGTHANKVLNDIREWFDNGKQPEVSNLSQFRYSLSEVTEEQNERGLDRKSEVSFSLSHDTEYMDKAIAKNNTSLLADKKAMSEAKVLRERIATRMNDIKDRGLVGLPEDIEGNTYIANSSYDGTEENTTICPRSLASEAFMDAVSEYLGRPLTVEEQIYISQDLQGRSMTPECTYCYVATDRKAYRAFLGEYVTQRDAVLQDYASGNWDTKTYTEEQIKKMSAEQKESSLYVKFLNGRKPTTNMASRFSMWIKAAQNGTPLVDASHLANINKLMGDINSEFGEELKPQIVDAMKYAQSASWAKKRVNYVAYNGHILNWKQDRINKLNSHYGLRMYSFSDFHPAFVLENMQMITDASVRGLKMLGYTKDTDFVDIFAPSGMNINVSTFGFEVGGNVYENNIIGAEWEKAKALREQYPNVGITFVATNDNLVNWALNQGWIDVVIPYHLVRTGAEVAKAFGYTNYTSESSDTKTKDWNKGKDQKYIAPTEHNNDKSTYLAALEKNHLKPRFERFIENPNYMKLVNECRQPASVSKPVQPVFNENAAMVALAKLEANGYYQPIGGSVERMYEIAAEVAEDMTQQLAPAMSLSGNERFKRSINDVYGKDFRVQNPFPDIAPIVPNAKPTPVLANAEDESDMFPDEPTLQTELDNLIHEQEALENQMLEMGNTGDFSELEAVNERWLAVQERIAELESEISETESARVNSLDDADVPPEMEAPYPGERNRRSISNPFADRDWYEVGRNRSVKAFMRENPEFKPFFQEAAGIMAYDLLDTQKAERWYNDQLHYDTGGEKGFGGQKRFTSDDIAEMLDSWGLTYAQIEEGLTAIIEDNDKVNNAPAKRIEFKLHERLANGYKDFHTGKMVEPNQAYLDMLYERQINQQSQADFDSFMETADQYAPEDIAPVPVQPLAKATPDTDPAPVYQTKEPGEVVGQTTMFEPPKPNQSVARVLTEPSKKTAAKAGFGMGVVTQVVDKGMAVENLAYKTGNTELQGKYHMAQHSTTAAEAQYFMENGADGVRPYNDVVREIKRSGKEHDFDLYLRHALNMDRMSLKQRFGMDNMAVFGDSVTAEMSRAEVAKYEAKNPEFKTWANDIYSNLRYMRNMLVKGNLASQKTADWWEKKYPHYVPITRVDAQGANVSVPLDTNKTGVTHPIKRATGGNSNIEPLLNTIAQRIDQTYSAIGRNAFGIELKNTLGTTLNRQMNNADVEEVVDTLDDQESKLLKPGTKTSNPTFTVFENGERVEFEITEELYDSMKSVGKILGHRFENSDKAVVRGVGKALNARRNLLTNWNPVFAWYRNPIKDIQDVAINSQHPLRTYLNMPNAIYQYATNGKYATEYHQHGGKANTFYDSRTNKFVEKNAAQKLLGLYEAPGEFIEEIPRLAEYIASRQDGRSVERSMLDAARVTTNFAAGGDFTKFLNTHGFTFLNASVQGASQHVRNFRESYHTQGAMGVVKTLAKYVIAGIPTIVFNGLLWDDDEEYEELNDYVKQSYYVIDKTDDGKFVRIPKGRTAAVMGELMQQMEHLVTGDDEEDFSTFYELFMNNIAPNNPLENNILAPIGQVMSNTAWYGGDLVPTRLQDLPAEEQYDESTDTLSKWIGEKTGTSPYKWNYLLDQYSGGLGDVFLPMMTPEAESGDNSLMGNILAPWKKEITTDKVLNNKNPGDFYDLKDELAKKSNSRKATEEDTMRSMYMDSVSWEMSDLYKQKREVQNSDLPDDEKYEEVRSIQEQINALAENALNNYNHVSIDGLYSEVGDKRYNKDEESGKWYEIREKNSDGTDNFYYQKEQEVTKALGITYGEYWNNREEYNYAYDKPEQYTLSQAVGGYDSYRKYTSELWDISADKDENGKSIAYSRKNKVIEYLNNLDADYYTKILLFKNEYNADDTYNMEIIDYLNSREDISYSEMETILKYLGFNVDSEGNITWD